LIIERAPLFPERQLGQIRAGLARAHVLARANVIVLASPVGPSRPGQKNFGYQRENDDAEDHA
jgi:hypothetical protein